MSYKLYENLVTPILIAGIVLIVIGSIIILGSIIRDIKSSGSVVIFIGPVPVAISWGEWGPLILLISIVILITMFLFTYLMLKYRLYSG